MDPAVQKAVDEAIHGIGRWWPCQWIARQAMWQADPLGLHTRVVRERWVVQGSSSEDPWTGKIRTSGGGPMVADVATTGWLKTQGQSLAWGPLKPAVDLAIADRRYSGIRGDVTLRLEAGEGAGEGWSDLPMPDDSAAWAAVLAEARGLLGPMPGEPSAELRSLGWDVIVTDEAKAAYATAVTPAIETRRAEIMAEVDRLATVIASLYRADDALAAARAEYTAAGGRGGPGPWITLSEESLRREAEGRRAAIR